MSDPIELNGVVYRQLFPGLFRRHTTAESIRLRKALVEDGIDTALKILNADGVRWVIDGWERLLLAAEFKFGPEQIPEQPYPEGADDAWLCRVATNANFARRQLTPEQCAQLVLELRRERKSQRVIAAEVGISQSTVQRILETAGDSGESPETVSGADGKTYPAKKPDYEQLAGEMQQLADAGNDAETIGQQLGIPTPAVIETLAAGKMQEEVIAAAQAAKIHRMSEVLQGRYEVVLKARSPVGCPECGERFNFGRLILT